MTSSYRLLSVYLREEHPEMLFKFSVHVVDRFVESLDIKHITNLRIRNIYLSVTLYAILIKDIRLVLKTFGNLDLLINLINELNKFKCSYSTKLESEIYQYFLEQKPEYTLENIRAAYLHFDKTKYIDAVIQTQYKEIPNLLVLPK